MPATGKRRVFPVALGVTAMSVVFWIAWWTHPRPVTPHPATPERHRDENYIGATACKACHPGEYASWHRTFHRSMTRRIQELSFDGKRGPLLPASLTLYGQNYELSKEGPAVVLTGPDLHEVAERLRALALTTSDGNRAAERAYLGASSTKRQVVLATGSHHYLAFWAEGGHDQELRQVPFVFLLKERKWLPRAEAFLQPPHAVPRIARWNANCIQCHSVAGRPGQREGRDPSGHFWESYDSDVADFGIACEACHGPGRQHADQLRSPFKRHEERIKGDGTSDGTSRARLEIFVPGQDPQNRGSQACGQCHSYFLPRDPDEWWQSGFSRSFQPGRDLDTSRTILQSALASSSSPENDLEVHRKGASPTLSIEPASLFWDDGGIVVGGREYNALTASPCNQRGHGRTKMGCTSCHSMHASEPNHQLKRQFLPSSENPSASDGMCLQCHKSTSTSHSGHRHDSEGARCVSCHMPNTSYALLQGVASHFITSPRPVAISKETSAVRDGLGTAPNACSLCHVDRTAAWINDRLLHIWKVRLPGSNADKGKAVSTSPWDSVPWAVGRALVGNAAERALYAYALGNAQDQNGVALAWCLTALDQLTNDPYLAIQHIARRSLTQLEAGRAAPFALFEEQRALLSTLHEMRDDTPLTISE